MDTALAMPVGSKAHPMTDAQLWQKLETCLAAAPGFAPMPLMEQLQDLDPARPARQLTAALQTQP